MIFGLFPCFFSYVVERGQGEEQINLSSTVIISIVVGLIVLVLFVGAPIKPMRFLGQGVVKLAIGVLFLFFLNVFGGAIGLHVPINIVTTAIAGFLGIFGLASLTAIQIFLIV